MQGNLYAVSGTTGGGEVIVVDTYRMVPLGRFGTPSPGGVALTANGTGAASGRLAVSNFSANTVTVYDISKVMWFVDQSGALPGTVGQRPGGKRPECAGEARFCPRRTSRRRSRCSVRR